MECRVSSHLGPSGPVTVIVCGRRDRRRKCSFCTSDSRLECDYPTSARASGTCDKPLCQRHAKRVGPNRDYCHDHETAVVKP